MSESVDSYGHRYWNKECRRCGIRMEQAHAQRLVCPHAAPTEIAGTIPGLHNKTPPRANIAATGYDKPANSVDSYGHRYWNKVCNRCGVSMEKAHAQRLVCPEAAPNEIAAMPSNKHISSEKLGGDNNTNVKGKIVGAGLGAIILGPIGAAIGAVAGAILDEGGRERERKFVYVPHQSSQKELAAQLQHVALADLKAATEAAKSHKDIKSYAVFTAEFARRFKNGIGVREDKRESFRWALESANAGLQSTQFAVGAMYLDEEGKAFNGVGLNLDEAVRWIEMSSKQGFRDAVEVLPSVRTMWRADRIQRAANQGERNPAGFAKIMDRIAADFSVAHAHAVFDFDDDHAPKLIIFLMPIKGKKPYFIFSVIKDNLEFGAEGATVPITKAYPSNAIWELLEGFSGNTQYRSKYVAYYDNTLKLMSSL